jgi:hypothetical protein
MEDMEARLDADGGGRRHWHGVYRRGTVAVRDEIKRECLRCPALRIRG